ncbi:MAG: AraC family transcriptional regulator [Cytophagales bacterium]
MSTISIHIKNMVCNRCKLVVEAIFRDIDVEPVAINLGEVKLLHPLNERQTTAIKKALLEKGFELIDDRKSLLLEKTKSLVIDKIHHHKHFELKINWSHYLAEKLDEDYSHISSLFSLVEGITLEQYIIKQKIEKVKEYLFYDELSVKEIAYQLGYSSVAHLSTQFKKVTGLSPSQFKENRDNSIRRSIDQIT